MSFTHLHVSTAFSAHYGVSWPDELAQAAAAQGATALGCTDRDGLYGTVKHLKACMAAGIDPVVGVDLSVFDDEGDHEGGVPDSQMAGVRFSKTRFSAERVTGRVVILAHGHNKGAGPEVPPAAQCEADVGVRAQQHGKHRLQGFRFQDA